MNRKRLLDEFARLKEAYPGAKLTDDGRFLFLPSVLLPPKYNIRSTSVLISLVPKQNHTVQLPQVFVPEKLREAYGPNLSFVPLPDNHKLASGGWMLLCWQNPPDVEDLGHFVASLLLYLDRLK